MSNGTKPESHPREERERKRGQIIFHRDFTRMIEASDYFMSRQKIFSSASGFAGGMREGQPSKSIQQGYHEKRQPETDDGGDRTDLKVITRSVASGVHYQQIRLVTKRG